MNCSSLKEITIPNSVIKIGENAFSECKKLEKIKISNDKTQIFENAIPENCTIDGNYKRLYKNEMVKDIYIDIYNEIIINPGFCKIDSSLFANCLLRYVSIPNDVEIISAGAFKECKSLEKITIPPNNNIKIIEQEAFLYCIKIREIPHLENVTKIGHSAFSCCFKLQNIIPSTKLKTITCNVYAGCTSLKNIAIPNSVEEIYENAFSGCKGIQKITFPNAIKYIHRNAFENCDSIKTIKIPKKKYFSYWKSSIL